MTSKCNFCPSSKRAFPLLSSVVDVVVSVEVLDLLFLLELSSHQSEWWICVEKEKREKKTCYLNFFKKSTKRKKLIYYKVIIFQFIRIILQTRISLRARTKQNSKIQYLRPLLFVFFHTLSHILKNQSGLAIVDKIDETTQVKVSYKYELGQ